MIKTQKNFIPLFALALLLSFLFVLPSSFNVFAAETAEVKIPVSAKGAPCTVAVYDADGTELAELLLGAEEQGELTLTCEGLHTLNYTVKLKDEDTAMTTYDRTIYGLTVELYHVGDSGFSYSIEVDPLGVIGDGKVEELTFTNTYNLLLCKDDPPVRKTISGKPATDSEFTFVMTAKDPAFPMPEGAKDDMKEVAIKGAGEVELGEIVFTESGLYEYTVAEKDTGISGYTYDTNVFTVRYEVTDDSGQLQLKRTLLKNGESMSDQSEIVFTNVYKKTNDDSPSDRSKEKTPEPSAHPRTGDENNTALWFTLMCASLIAVLIFGHKRKRNR